MYVGVRVRRSKTGPSHSVLVEDGFGFVDRRPGCRWRCNILMCIRVWVCRCKTGLSSHRRHGSCQLMRVGVRVCRAKRGLSQRVFLEVGSQYYFLNFYVNFLFVFWFVLQIGLK